MKHEKVLEVLENQNLKINDLERKVSIGKIKSKLKFNKASLLYIKQIIHKKRMGNYIKKNYTVYHDLENRNRLEMVRDRVINTRKKIVVYTCITGNYDKIPNISYMDEEIDYYLFSDKNLTSDLWNIVIIPNNILMLNDNILINRYLKMHPSEFFGKEYEISIYIDGNVNIISDLRPWAQYIENNVGLAFHRHYQRDCLYLEAEVLKIYGKGNPEQINKQVLQYKRNGFPKNYGLPEATTIVSDLKNEYSSKILDSWWVEFKNSGSYRDQLSLPYILWKNNIDVSSVTLLGNNLYRSAKISVKSH